MVRINTILCPIDFSDFSRHAFDRAVAIAKGVGASVTALHVAPFREAPIYPYQESRAVEAFLLSAGDRDMLTTELKRFLALDAPLDVPVTCEVVDAPNVHHEILARADRLRADLIVMGTHGRSGFQRLFLGSVTEKVLRTARPPVLIVGAATDVVPARDFSFKRILCAVDFSACSLAALRYAATLAEPSGAKLTALYVMECAPSLRPIRCSGRQPISLATEWRRKQRAANGCTRSWQSCRSRALRRSSAQASRITRSCGSRSSARVI